MKQITPSLISEIFKGATNQRLKFEKRWYLVDSFFEGKHFVDFLSTTGSLVSKKFPTGINVSPIPRLKKQIETIINLVFSKDPRWMVYPTTIDNQKEIDKAQKISDVFKVLWNVLEAKEHFKEATSYALKHNVGYVEVGIDGEGKLFFDHYDTYNIYHDPTIETLEEATYLIKVVSKTIDELQNSSIYDKEEVAKLQPTNKYSEAQYENIRETEKFQNPATIKDTRIEKVLVKEFWIKSGNTWSLTTECQGHILRDTQTVPYSLPFVEIKLSEGQMYQTSIFEDLIPLNKKIDVFIAYIEKYIKGAPMGTLLVPESSKLKRIINKDGEMIQYEGVTPPQWLTQPPLNPVVISFIEILKQLMDERAVSVMAFGTLPPGVKAWRALESLKNIEFANLQTSIDNLNHSIQRITYKLLEIIENGVTDPMPIVYEKKGQLQQFNLVSQSAYDANASLQTDKRTIPMSSRYRIKVETEAGAAFTEQGRQETAIQLSQMGKIDDKTLLDMLHFSNVGDIIEKSQKQKEEDARNGMLNQEAQNQRSQAQAPNTNLNPQQ